MKKIRRPPGEDKTTEIKLMLMENSPKTCGVNRKTGPLEHPKRSKLALHPTSSRDVPVTTGQGSMLSRALAYAAKGWAVFPLVPHQKVPFKESHSFKDATTDAETIRQLWTENTEANIGIATGRASGIFVLDADLYKGADKSLANLRKQHGPLPPTYSVQTARNGRHFYYQTPSGVIIASGENKLGSWLDVKAEGGYVVAPPSVFEGKAYKVLNATQPAVCPEWLISLLCRAAGTQTNSCISTSLQPCITTSLHNNPPSVILNIKAKGLAESALSLNHPQLMNLYRTFIEPRFQAMAGARNAFIVQAVPFLYRVVCADAILDLARCFYEANRLLFNDSVQKHITEATAMLASTAKTYLESLTQTEREIYSNLPDARERDAFRICRDLALLQPEPDREPFTFYMAFGHLGDRLGIQGPQAQRIMRQFESYGLLKLVRKGTRRSAGVRGEPGQYQWLLDTNANSEITPS